MDFIKKTICIEGARTRTQGLMPYYEYGTGNNELIYADGNNGNWGQFVANPDFLSDNNKTYESMLRKYYDMLNMVRSGVKLRKVETKEGEIIFTEDVGGFSWNTCESGQEGFVGGEEPDYLYEYRAFDASEFTYSEIDSLREETRRIYRYSGEETIECDFIVLIKDYAAFTGLSKYLKDTEYFSELAELDPPDIYSPEEDEHLEWARYCKVVDLCIGKIDIPSRIYNKHIKVPKSMLCADVESYIEWLTNYQSLSADCCNTRLWEDMGGDDMFEYLETSAKTKCEKYADVLNGLDYTMPYIEMPILITQNYTDVGVLTNVDGVKYDETLPGPSAEEDELTRPHGKLQTNDSGLSDYDIDIIIHSGECLTIDQIIMCSGETRHMYPTTEEFELNPDDYTDDSGFTNYPVEVESLLQSLRSRKKYTDDKDNVLPGLFRPFEEYPSGKMFRCIRQGVETFYDLIIIQDDYVESGVTYHTLEYYWSENDSYTKEDVDPSNFYQGFPGVPYSKFIVGENESDWQERYNERLSLMEDYATPSAHTPISVAINEWRMEEIPYVVTDFVNGDGEQSESLHYPESEINTIAGKHYRTITTCAAGIRIAETEEEENGEDQPFMEHYYFKVKYDNSPESPMEIPFKKGNLTNVYYISSGETSYDPFYYRGDFINEEPVIFEESGVTYFETTYIVGGFFSGDENGTYNEYIGGGDVYYEKHPYDPAHVDYVALDGVDNVPVWSEYVDFNADSKEFYSTRYNLYRTGNTANIIEATTGEQWLSGETYDAYLTKEDYLINFSLPPKVDVNVTVDRGGVSAFEKHYKLSECNTMQDLMQYNNGEFFPDNI